MIVRIKVEDELYEAYEKLAEVGSSRGKQITPEDLMANQLVRFQKIHPMDRPLVISAAIRQKMEALLGGIFLGSEEDLLSRLETLTDIQIEGVRVNFQPGQLTNIKRYATKNGWSLDVALEKIVQEMAGRFVDYVPAS